MRALLLGLMLACNYHVDAQGPLPDSREFALAFNASLDKARAFQETVASAEKALGIAKTLRQDSLIQLTETQLGILYWNDGELGNALLALNDGARIANLRNDVFGFARCMHYAALTQYYQCHFDSALALYTIAEDSYTRLHIDSAVAKIKSHKALIYSVRGEYDRAIQALIEAHRIQESMPGYRDFSVPMQFPSDAARRMYYKNKLERDLESMTFLEQGGDRSTLAFTWFNVGKDYFYIGEFKQAVYYLKKSVKGFTDLEEAPYYSDLAAAYAEAGHLDSAHFYYRIAIAREKERGTRIHLTNIYGSLATLYEKEKNYEGALGSWAQAQALNKKIGLRRSEAVAGKSRADLLLLLGRTRDALNEINASLAIANELDIPGDKQGFLNSKGKILAALGRYAEAVAAMEQSRAIGDRVANGESNLQIAQQEIGYESEKKNRDLQRLQAENKLKQVEIENQNLMLLAGVALVIMTTAIIFLVYRRYRNKVKTSQLLEKQNKLIQSQNSALTIKAREEEALMREIHHRVKNNLQVISSLINLKLGQSSEETAEALHQLNGRIFSMGLIHEKLYQKENLHTIRLDEYLCDLARYLVGTLGRDDLKVQLTLDCDPLEMDAERVVSYGLISNELITNAMKHAFPGVREPAIRVALKSIDHALHFEISDNGIGRPLMEEKKSFGMRFVEQLAANKLGGTLRLESRGGFRTLIVVPSDGRSKEKSGAVEVVAQDNR